MSILLCFFLRKGSVLEKFGGYIFGGEGGGRALLYKTMVVLCNQFPDGVVALL